MDSASKLRASREEGRYQNILQSISISIKINTLASQIYIKRTHVMENTVTVQPTALKPSIVKTTEFELERY